MTRRKTFFLLFLPLLISSCGITIEIDSGQDQITSTPIIEPQAEQVEPTPEPLLGGISGDLSYPSEYIPPLRIVAFRLENGQPSGGFSFVMTDENQNSYQIDGLDPGQYWVVAYTIPEGGDAPHGLAGGFSQAVPCGLSVECTDHTLIAVEVQANQITEGIDPLDWYVPEGTFPQDPNY